MGEADDSSMSCSGVSKEMESPFCSVTSSLGLFSSSSSSSFGSAATWGIALAVILLSLIVLVVFIIWIQRRLTYRKLVQSGLPTVFWRPKFVNYVYPEDLTTSLQTEQQQQQEQQQEKLASSTITNILPRMKRLNGPYGMYGTVYGVSTPVVHVAHPVPANAILSANDGTSVLKSSGVTKLPAYNHFKNFCGEGVFTADGDDWKAKRAAVMHALIRGSGGGGGGYQAKVEHQAHLAAKQLEHEFEYFSKKESPVNVVPVLQRATIGLIYRYTTHTDLKPLMNDLIKAERKLIFQNGGVDDDDEEDDVDSISTASTTSSAAAAATGDNDSISKESPKKTNRKLEDVNDDDDDDGDVNILQSYLKSITRIRMIILAQSRSIWFLMPRWVYRTFADLFQQEERTMGPIRDLAQQACRDAMKQPTSPLALLHTNHANLYGNNNNNNNKSSNIAAGFSKNLIDEAITLLFAGQDTSAATLSWTLHLLSLYPAVQEKLAKEVISVFEEEEGSGEDGNIVVNKKLISKMTYLDAVIKESMRLYPVAPFVVRKLPAPLTIPASPKNTDSNTTQPPQQPSITLPAGSFACIWIYSLHRNPDYWSQPNDFVPERWLEKKDKGITMGAYMPFAAGPRNCVGQPLAQPILRSVLSRLVYRYQFQDPRVNYDNNNGNSNKTETTTAAAEDFRKDMQAGFTVLPKGGVMLNVRQRQHKNS